MLKDRMAECKFCKQMVLFKWNEDAYLSDEDMIEQGTLACKCESALWYKARGEKIAATQERIEDMLADGEEAAAKELLLENVHNIFDKKVFSISVNIGNGTSITMKRSKDNNIKLKRTDKEDREELV